MSNKPKHNPGPWHVQHGIEYDGARYYNVVDGEGILLACTCARKASKRKANAAMMAAAPELLDALKEAVLEYGCVTSACDMERDCIHFDRENWRCKQGQGKCFVQRWLAAIRKAEGLK